MLCMKQYCPPVSTLEREKNVEKCQEYFQGVKQWVSRNTILIGMRLVQVIGLKVVAEGIETEEQKGFLASNGCDYAQGYLFSRPVLPAELAQYLSKTLPDNPVG